MNIYVGNLNYDMSEDDLKNAFEEYGAVESVKIIIDRYSGRSKGFGFIIDDESKTEYFVHVTGLIDEINEGDAVEFELQEGRKGLNAVNVKTA